MTDPYNLQRFLDAQEPVFDAVCEELLQGRKTSHWMWFIFPQIEGLGNSTTARKFAVSSRAEAQAYLDHPVLGRRLRECSQIVNSATGRSAREIFGYPDELKFRSCMTLFAALADDADVFVAALTKYFDGKPDDATIARL